MLEAAPTRLLLVTGLDPLDLGMVAWGLHVDLEGSGVLQVAFHPDDRTVSWDLLDFTGSVEHGEQQVDHFCLTCAINQVIVPLLRRLAASGTWSWLVVALPPTAEAGPLTRALHVVGDDRLVVHRVLAVPSAHERHPDTLADGVFGDATLVDLGLALVPGDDRAYGEALAAQLEFADTIVLPDEHPDAETLTLLDHLRRPGSVVRRGRHSCGGPAEANAPMHDFAAARAFVDPRARRPTGAPDAGDITTLDLRSWKPFHPARLLSTRAALGGGRQRARGHFWLPGRPHEAIAWDAAGGELGIGKVSGGWEAHERGTRLVVTTDAERAAGIRDAFRWSLMTDAEMVGAADRWRGVPDGFEGWLDDPHAAGAA